MPTFTYEAIMEAAAQTTRDMAAREARETADRIARESARLENPPLTREQVESVSVGDAISQTFDRRSGLVLPDARWGEAREVVSITFRGVSVNGKAYVGGYLKFGETSTISFSFSEGDTGYRVKRD